MPEMSVWISFTFFFFPPILGAGEGWTILYFFLSCRCVFGETSCSVEGTGVDFVYLHQCFFQMADLVCLTMCVCVFAVIIASTCVTVRKHISLA